MSRSLHDGRKDGLEPLESLALDQVGCFRELLRGMAKTAFSGRQLGEAFDVLVEMAKSEPCHIVLTLTGAMTVAKQGRIICDLIDRGVVDTVVTTGALIAHGLTESIGLTHYRHDPSKSDEELFDRGYNRIYDTLEMESNLNGVEQLVRRVLDEEQPPDGVWSSARLCHAIGRKLSDLDVGPGILRSAFERDVPVFIPAFTDSEIGLDVSIWAMANALEKSDRESLTPDQIFEAVPPFNPFLDLQEYARRISATSELGILTIGGGVPRNWSQQAAPYIDIVNDRFGARLVGPRFRYGVRICPEPVQWGGLSGCTYSEGVSWGKFVPVSEGGRYAEVYSDATVALPLLACALFEELDAEELDAEDPDRGGAETRVTFLGLPQSSREDADIVVLPLPFEGTVSYGAGTAAGPDAVLAASQQVELWDDEVEFDLETAAIHTAEPIGPVDGERTGEYLARVEAAAGPGSATILGIGGEHSITPPLVRAARGSEDLSGLTVVQIDAHTDLRKDYEGDPHSHACAMRRLTDAGASLVAIGVRSISREEAHYAASSDNIEIHRAQSLALEPELARAARTIARNPRRCLLQRGCGWTLRRPQSRNWDA